MKNQTINIKQRKLILKWEADGNIWDFQMQVDPPPPPSPMDIPQPSSDKSMLYPYQTPEPS